MARVALSRCAHAAQRVRLLQLAARAAPSADAAPSSPASTACAVCPQMYGTPASGLHKFFTMFARTSPSLTALPADGWPARACGRRSRALCMPGLDVHSWRLRSYMDGHQKDQWLTPQQAHVAFEPSTCAAQSVRLLRLAPPAALSVRAGAISCAAATSCRGGCWPSASAVGVITVRDLQIQAFDKLQNHRVPPRRCCTALGC